MESRPQNPEFRILNTFTDVYIVGHFTVILAAILSDTE